MLDVEATFCYLGDMLCFGGDCGSAIVVRCFVASGKFGILLFASPRIRGKVYEACIRTALLLGSETWWPTEPELPRLRRNDCAMIRWICGIIDRDKTPSATLLQKLGIEHITSVLRCRWLGWCGHVQLAMPCIRSITNFQIPGTRKEGRPWKTSSDCV